MKEEWESGESDRGSKGTERDTAPAGRRSADLGSLSTFRSLLMWGRVVHAFDVVKVSHDLETVQTCGEGVSLFPAHPPLELGARPPDPLSSLTSGGLLDRGNVPDKADGVCFPPTHPSGTRVLKWWVVPPTRPKLGGKCGGTPHPRRGALPLCTPRYPPMLGCRGARGALPQPRRVSEYPTHSPPPPRGSLGTPSGRL